MGLLMSTSSKKTKFFLLSFFLLSLLSLTFPLVDASFQMKIEVLPPQPISGQNFTISVYDPTIINDSPYLIDVNVTFEQMNYMITKKSPNRELELTAPDVYVPTAYTIFASKSGYNDTNKTIIILPVGTGSPHIVITVISETIIADTLFTLKVTDEFNNPIENATVSIQNQQSKETDGLTNETGHITLRAPNQQEINILAQKEGYEEDEVNLWVRTTTDTTTALLSHPVTPIIIAIGILICTIIFVNIKNRRKISKPKLSLNNTKKKNYFTDSKPNIKKPLKTAETKKETYELKPSTQIQSSKIEEIHITKPHVQKAVLQVNSKTNEQPTLTHNKSHQWFSENETIEQKVDDILSERSTVKETEKWFEGTASLRDAIDTTVKQKQKKKQTKST